MKTACPLDCYDSCEIEVINGKITGAISHPLTNGYLCPILNSYDKFPQLQKGFYNHKEVTLTQALDILVAKLKEFEGKKSLLYRGSGNLGKMQTVTNKFFYPYGSTFTKGSLCDGAGEAGIIKGRENVINMPISEIKKSEVVVIWGRNISDTNSHLYNIIKNKTLIVIDPIKTKIASKSKLHIQIKPRTDIYLAILLSRFAIMEEMEDKNFIKNHTKEFDWFLEFINSFRLNHLAKQHDIDLLEIDKFLEIIKGKKVSFLLGIGVQKYSIGHFIFWSIESFIAMVGFFDKEGSGVHYLGNSGFGFLNPFAVKGSEPKPSVDFSKYDLVFIQGANPMVSNTLTDKIKEGLKGAKFVIYFGLYENETSKMADLIIPCCNFLEKNDIKISYGHEYLTIMSKINEPKFGISEYDLTKFLIDKFNYEKLKGEKEYIDEIVNSNSYIENGVLKSKTYQNYKTQKDTFDKFIFIDEFEDEPLDENGYYLITAKSKKSLNSQFEIDNYLYIKPNPNFKEGQTVLAKSKYGKYQFKLKFDKRLRDDCVLIYSGAIGGNYLTPNKTSQEGDNAVFQDVKIKLEIQGDISNL